MNILGFSIAAGAWLAPITGIAILGVAATLILLRDHLRLERHAMKLQAENEQLKSELGRLTGAVDPHGRRRQSTESGASRFPGHGAAHTSPNG